MDSQDNIQNILSFEQLNRDYNVIKTFKVKLNSGNTVKVPSMVNNIFSFTHKDLIKLEHDMVDDKSYVYILPLNNSVCIDEIKNNSLLIDQSKLILKDHIKRIVFPKNLRKEVNLNANDWFVLSVYKNSQQMLYIEILKLDDLINNNLTNQDELVYRISEEVSFNYSSYYFIPDDILMDLFNIRSYEIAKWNLLLDKTDIIHLEFE
ncbi:hypothetical protein [Methanosphaera sp. BMS]|uniref:hypothetical protein n=1 Tax=Methanosphaera sp. BMS TaxID=1789762 RepID=UPI000DC1D6F1|nr:hypothetical protein [Methanosphaera sp. BMS]AWX31834.1 hypothetical protein AW729_01450 [Methanosphaera sp. BMS]